MLFVFLTLIPLTVAGCLIFNKTVHELLPVSVFVSVLGTYILALFTSLTVAFYVMCVVSVIFLAVIFIFSRKLRNTVFETKEPSLCLIFVCVLFCLLMSYRRVYFYDDLSYWAIYTRNIFAIDKLPTLFENCSVDYKDYTPIIQILQYLVMFGRKEFSEAPMFQTNICLIYILLLPLLSVAFDAWPEYSTSQGRKIGVKVAAVAMYVVFPHILTAQFYYRLGVDLLLALTFGYVLYYIFVYDRTELRQRDGSSVSENMRQKNRPPVSKDEVFRLVCIVTGLSFLTLIKTSGPVLAIMAVIMFALREGMANVNKDRRHAMMLCAKTAILCLFTLGAFLSWQWFLRRSWNNGYLSNRVKDGVKGGSLVFPEYTREVTLNYIKQFFIFPLTRNSIGVTAFVLVMFIVIVAMIQRRSESEMISGFSENETKEPSPCLKKLRQKNRPLVSIMGGLVVFCMAHLGMYLFIFDDWEAYGLMEFDRYITQYLGGAFMLYVCILIKMARDHKDAPEAGSGSANAAKTALFISLAAFIALLPYEDMRTYLIPANYRANYEKNYEKTAYEAAQEWEESGLAQKNLPHDGTARVTVIADSWDEQTQHLIYTAVPQPIDCVINTPAIGEGELVSYMDDHLESYVYVAKNAKDAYTGNWDESGQLTRDHTPLLPGTLYRVVRENDTKTLVEAE